MKTTEEIELIEELGLNKRLSFVLHYIIQSQRGSDPKCDLKKAAAWLEREIAATKDVEKNSGHPIAARAVSEE